MLYECGYPENIPIFLRFPDNVLRRQFLRSVYRNVQSWLPAPHIAVAVNEVIRLGGGVVFSVDHTVKGTIALPMGGIMNPTTHPDELLAEFEHFNALTKRYGGSFDNPAFPLSLMLTCACIPELKITNRALVDALSGKPVSLFAEDETVDNQ